MALSRVKSTKVVFRKISLAHVTKPIKQRYGYWNIQENIDNFLLKIKGKYNLNTPDDWNSITREHIQVNGGNTLLCKYSMYDIKCMACPEGASSFYKQQPSGYWENQENIDNFLSKLKLKYNLNTPEDWDSITWDQIQSNGGRTLLKKYSMYDIKCMACPEGKLKFKKTPFPPGYWENQENIDNFLSKIKEKYNLNTPEDWNSITKKLIGSNGGISLLSKYSMFEIKCMACPDGKSTFSLQKQPVGYWENEENVLHFLSQIKIKYNLNTPEDWNSITREHIRSNGGGSLFKNYTIYELKCMACPEGKSSFTDPPVAAGYWESKKNIDKFLSKMKEKYNLNTPEDWNTITKDFIYNEGKGLLKHYSIFEIKCMACPEGKSIFNNPPGYWENQENIDNFLSKLKEKYNLNTPEDWNSITTTHIQTNGGNTLLSKYSIFEIKCLACPEGKSIFNNPPQRYSLGYWEIQENIDNFLSKIIEKYNLITPEDWKRISKLQITTEGGRGLFNSKLYSEIKIKFETPNETTKFIPFSKLISKSNSRTYKRASQRWLFLQIQKLFPGEEIVEDYFHSEISRISGFNIQFDIFMIGRNIAIEYHGKHHYEDIPSGFGNLETYKQRDVEKGKLCLEHGVQLIVIPYWWDNKLDSLRSFLNSKINL